MLFFRKKKPEPEKNPIKKLDKFIMGAIIGGAIGSVLSLTLGARSQGEKDEKNSKDKPDAQPESK